MAEQVPQQDNFSNDQQSFADYVRTDAFQQATAQAQQQQGAGNAYQQPWSDPTNQYSQQDTWQDTGYGQQYYYTQQSYGSPYVRTKDHVAAGLLAIFLGFIGVHKFYLGYNTAGFIMLGATILGSLITFGLAGSVMTIIGIIEGIIYLTKSQSRFDAEYVYGHREWF